MKNKIFITVPLLFVAMALVGRSVFALFVSKSTNSNNSLSTANIFPTKQITPTPTLNPTPTVEPTPTIVPTIAPTLTEIPSPTPTDYPVPTVTPTPSPTPEITQVPTPTTEIVPSPTPTPLNIANHIVISEVQIQGDNASQDFVELYNPTESTINIAGWNLRQKNSTGTESSLIVFATGKIIPSHGFFLWATTDYGYNVTIGADDQNGNNISSNGSLVLKDNNGVIIDQLAWGNGLNQFVENTPFSDNPSTNYSSLERKAYATSNSTSMSSGIDVNYGNGFDTDNNSTDFVLRTTSYPQNTNSSTETP